MNCSLCENKASFVCKFCGRIICDEHQDVKPYIMGAYDEKKDDPQLIVTEDAAWCGKCHPASNPIRVSEME